MKKDSEKKPCGLVTSYHDVIGPAAELCRAIADSDIPVSKIVPQPISNASNGSGGTRVSEFRLVDKGTIRVNVSLGCTRQGLLLLLKEGLSTQEIITQLEELRQEIMTPKKLKKRLNKS